MIEFILGLIVGLLVNPFRKDVIIGVKNLKEKIIKEQSQFIEPIDKKEIWKNADSLSDILE